MERSSETVTPNEIATTIVDASLKTHVALGPGLLESAYEPVLAYELQNRGLRVRRQEPFSIVYETSPWRMPFADQVIVELKSVETVHPVHKKQLLTYLRLSGKPLGLLINFGARLLRGGITRVVNGLGEE